ncbi:MAG: hypothetical protein DCC88_00250 [Spirobacillus cienkowskii]|uniref:Uncharacterized protein n=1 Tax=Spirobacillus cienkowskii TaxID=495820 RepID=A0A369KRX5_9BACT|nr:MAG: hypothetical protein DCC88_00250 [Spirobacillus cienkowskii]
MLNYKLFFILLFIIISFFLGRKSVSEKLVIEKKIEKIRDEEAIKIAVEQAIKNVRSDFKSKVIVNKIKHKDGTLKFQKITSSEEIKLENSLDVNFKNGSVKTLDYEKKELNNSRKNFKLILFSGFENIKNLNYENYKTYFGSKIEYNVFNNLWLETGMIKYIDNKFNIFIGTNFKIEF